MKKCFKMLQPFCLLSFNQIRCGEKREKAENSLSFRFKISDGECPFPRPAPAVTWVLKLLRGVISQAKRPPRGEERGQKSVAIFEKKKKCKGSTFVAQKTSAYIIKD